MLQFGWETGLQLILNVVVLSELFPILILPAGRRCESLRAQVASSPKARKF